MHMQRGNTCASQFQSQIAQPQFARSTLPGDAPTRLSHTSLQSTPALVPQSVLPTIRVSDSRPQRAHIHITTSVGCSRPRKKTRAAVRGRCHVSAALKNSCKPGRPGACRPGRTQFWRSHTMRPRSFQTLEARVTGWPRIKAASPRRSSRAVARQPGHNSEDFLPYLACRLGPGSLGADLHPCMSWIQPASKAGGAGAGHWYTSPSGDCTPCCG